MEYREAELNGCCSMLCSGLRVWHRMHERRELAHAAYALKHVYDMEFHQAGHGCEWRKPEWDESAARAVMHSLGMDPEGDLDDEALVLASMLDGDPAMYTKLTGRIPSQGVDTYGPVKERMLTVEQYHNALRRMIPGTEWDTLLKRRVMDRNLKQLSMVAAREIHRNRTGQDIDLEALLDLCHDDKGVA